VDIKKYGDAVASSDITFITGYVKTNHLVQYFKFGYTQQGDVIQKKKNNLTMVFLD
jgi:hypothetical protein